MIQITHFPMVVFVIQLKHPDQGKNWVYREQIRIHNYDWVEWRLNKKWLTDALTNHNLKILFEFHFRSSQIISIISESLDLKKENIIPCKKGQVKI